MEIQELKIDEIKSEPLNVVESSNSGGNKSVNFGPGADLLMNHSRKDKDKNKSSSAGLDDLDSLKLDIDSTFDDSNKKSVKEARNDLFSGISISDAPVLEKDDNIKLDISEDINMPDLVKRKGILKGAIDKNEKTKTKDGFKKFNDIPINPDIIPPSKEKKLTGKELLKEKFKYLRLLEGIERKGATLSKKYSMDSNSKK